MVPEDGVGNKYGKSYGFMDTTVSFLKYFLYVLRGGSVFRSHFLSSISTSISLPSVCVDCALALRHLSWP